MRHFSLLTSHLSLFGAGCLAATLTAPAHSQSRDRDTLGLRPAFRLIDQFVEQEMQAENTPGLALALADRAGVITVRSYGYENLERSLPVTPATRFQIGSISKSFTAIALLQLMEEGKFDPHRPVRDYLPWFTPVSKWQPVTGHDLLTHTAGLPADRDDVPSSPAQGYAARERILGSAPGTRWSYSNVGYQVLGQLLEAIEKKPYREIIRERVIEPLNLTATDAEFTHETRTRMAAAYRRLYDDRPGRSGDPLVPAEWVEYASGDGSVVSNAGDLGAYLAMLLNGGEARGDEATGDQATGDQATGDQTRGEVGRGGRARRGGAAGRIVSPASFRLMTHAWAKTERGGDDYGYGLFLGALDGRPVFSHSGGMLGYTSYLIGEPALGVGAVAFVNGPGAPDRVARFAVRVLSAAMRGDTLPTLPAAISATTVDRPGRYAGTYRAPGGDSLVFAGSGDSLLLIRDGRRDALEPFDDDAFLGPRPEFALFPIRFGGDSSGITEVWYGGRWYAGPRYRGARPPAVPPEWRAYEGHYRIMQPWEPNFRVVIRTGRLWWIGPEGDEEPLTALGPREFRVGEPGSAERIRFDDVVDGKALKATFSGMVYYRFFTP